MERDLTEEEKLESISYMNLHDGEAFAEIQEYLNEKFGVEKSDSYYKMLFFEAMCA